MGAARVEVEVAPIERDTGLQFRGAQLSETGMDRVEFLIAPNPGDSPKPLGRVASGGELSRSLLALKCVLSGLGSVGLYVFDEVDAGIGGGIAEVIGRTLALVAKRHQVVAITHLAQVAIYADSHFSVHKAVKDERTHTTIQPLDENNRREELARMLGGVEITDASRQAATDLLVRARSFAPPRIGE